MKQYTGKDQTAKLIELGFPKPQSIESIDTEFDSAFDEHTIYNMRYSIGELIEFLNDHLFHIDKDYKWYADVGQCSFTAQELIDVLFKACVTLKEEGVI